MITEDQSKVVAFLSEPSSHGGAPVERIETHSAVVFLSGTRAWKLKRAVRYDYLDFSTLERRKEMCETEMKINRRTAPDLYLRVVPVTREHDGRLALGGTGLPIDWVLEMVRFDQEALFDRLAVSGRLDMHLMRSLASAIAQFHSTAERRPDRGGRRGIAWVIDGNAAGFISQGAGILDAGRCASLTHKAHAALERFGAQLDERREAGFVRQCHGDMHLRNIVLIDGRPILFDAIEFNDKIACIDVLYDLAFLLMDLWRRGLPAHANAVWNRYLAETGDLSGISLMPFFLSCRAAVRAKTSATSAIFQSDPHRRKEFENLARSYLSMATTMLIPQPPCLVAVGGLSGSGKSTLALKISPSVGAAPGALVLRSDEIRKRLFGVPEFSRLGAEGYSDAASRRVYATMAEHASIAIRRGYSVVADAVFANPANRVAIEAVAAELSVPFVGIWLDAPQSILAARVDSRQDDASDADATVVRSQLNRDTGPIHWQRIDASSNPDILSQQATDFLNKRLG
jgi:aminoglycoside phosphotransferase family enzyme/predicted kinase